MHRLTSTAHDGSQPARTAADSPSAVSTYLRRVAGRRRPSPQARLTRWTLVDTALAACPVRGPGGTVFGAVVQLRVGVQPEWMFGRDEIVQHGPGGGGLHEGYAGLAQQVAKHDPAVSPFHSHAGDTPDAGYIWLRYSGELLFQPSP
jgi:hypothetical protein